MSNDNFVRPIGWSRHNEHEYTLKKIKDLENNQLAIEKRIDVIQTCVISHNSSIRAIGAALILLLSISTMAFALGLVATAKICGWWL